MFLRTRCEFSFEISVPTPFILMLRPRSGAQQFIAREEYNLTPTVPLSEYTDSYGNLCQRLVAEPGPFAIATSADVRTTEHVDRDVMASFTEIQLLPDNVLSYLLPSRYCESEKFWEITKQITAGEDLGYSQVAAIESWMVDNIRYAPDECPRPISATEVYEKKAGVCRDLAHLGMAMCRSLSIPARMVVGYRYQLEPMDLHAWFEAFVGGRWYTFDAMQSQSKGGYVAIAYGRDAADVAIYTQFGPAVFPISQAVSVELLEA